MVDPQKTQDFERPEDRNFGDTSHRHQEMRKRNRMMGLALFAFVVILAVVSYFRVGALMP